jgi:hypothetical protein
MFCLQAFSEKLKCGIHDLLTRLALDAIETEDAQLLLAFFVWTLDKSVHVFIVRNPV